MPGRFWLVFSEIGLPCVFPSLFHLFFFCRTHNLLPGVSPSKDDDYICTGVSIGDLSPDKVKSTFDKVDPNRCFNQTVYAVSFSALGQDGPGIKAHHMILSKCKKPKKTGFGDTWDCQHHAMCNDQVYDCLHWLPKNTFVFPRQSKIMFAWAKHAQPTELPDDVGFSLQPDEYLVLQVCCTTIYISFHFLTLSTIAGALCKTPTKRSQWSVCDGETGKADLYSRWHWLWRHRGWHIIQACSFCSDPVWKFLLSHLPCMAMSTAKQTWGDAHSFRTLGG